MSKSKKPNILLIMPDQMRADCLSLEKHPVLKTPNIDAIGKGGTHFSNAYSTCPSCIAARRSLLTGLYPSTHGIVGYKEGIPLETPTVTQYLKDAGYSTVITGRYMHQSPAEEPYGFEKRILGSTYIRTDDYAKYLEKETPALGGIAGIGISCNGREARAWPEKEEHHPTNWTIRQAKNMIRESDEEKPLFLVTSFYAPHPPLFPPARFMEKFMNEDLPKPAIGNWEVPPALEEYQDDFDASRVDLRGVKYKSTLAGYFALNAQIDEAMPDLINDFKEKSIAAGRSWLIVFTSDHGEMLGDHFLFRKCEPYDGSTRIPLLIQGSADLELTAANRCETPVCLEDILPTLLDFAGISLPDHIDGKSLVGILKGEETQVRDILHCEHAVTYSEAQAFHMLTDGIMKYIWRPVLGSEQLFNLKEDPNELLDLKLNSKWDNELTKWRNLMIKKLEDRPEGFSDGKKLISHCEYKAVMPK